jgi:hypothetical protein
MKVLQGTLTPALSQREKEVLIQALTDDATDDIN